MIISEFTNPFVGNSERKVSKDELLALMRYLDPVAAEYLVDGEDEVREMMEELNMDKKVIESATGAMG